MILIILLATLCGLRYFEVGVFADLSWWWVTAALFLAFLWFEFGERLFGLDNRRADVSMEKAREERIKKAFEVPKNRPKK